MRDCLLHSPLFQAFFICSSCPIRWRIEYHHRKFGVQTCVPPPMVGLAARVFSHVSTLCYWTSSPIGHSVFTTMYFCILYDLLRGLWRCLWS